MAAHTPAEELAQRLFVEFIGSSGTSTDLVYKQVIRSFTENARWRGLVGSASEN